MIWGGAAIKQVVARSFTYQLKIEEREHFSNLGAWPAFIGAVGSGVATLQKKGCQNRGDGTIKISHNNKLKAVQI